MSTAPATTKVWEQNSTPKHRIQWCPGCGDFGVLNALKSAFTKMELMPHDVLMVGGIGCSGQIRNYLNGNSFHGTHGGALAYAVGAKMANPNLQVVALAGDGDSLAIGIENFVHVSRRDPNVTLIIMNNGVYGLTKGQNSPTYGLGLDHPEYTEENPPEVDPLRLAITCGASFVAQGFSGNPKHASELYVEALKHDGFALVNDFSPCVTYNKFNTNDWYKAHLDHVPHGHDPSSKEAAYRLLDDYENRGRLPLGIVYREQRNRKKHTKLPLWEQELNGIDPSPMFKLFS